MTVRVCAALLLCAGAVWMDLRSAAVSNIWLGLWLCAGAAEGLYRSGPAALLPAAAGMAVPVLLLFPFFYFRMLGAGDIKLLAVLGSYLGPGDILWCLLAAFLTGAVLSVLLFLRNGGWKERWAYFIRYVRTYAETGQKRPYRQPGTGSESLHMTVPILAAVLLWAGGLYPAV